GGVIWRSVISLLKGPRTRVLIAKCVDEALGKMFGVTPCHAVRGTSDRANAVLTAVAGVPPGCMYVPRQARLDTRARDQSPPENTVITPPSSQNIDTSFATCRY